VKNFTEKNLAQEVLGKRLIADERIMYIQRRHWLDYDPVALAVLVIGIGMIELLALII
jgi:hypothetical protein